MLEIEGLLVRYGPFLAVDGVDIRVDEGEIVGIIGPNGAGKSSIVKAVSGLVRPAGGTVRFRGKDIGGVPPHDRIRLGLSVVPEGRGIFPQMSVLENLMMGGYPLARAGRMHENIERSFELFPILRQRQTQLAGTLSGGQQQMLAIAMGLMSDPAFFIVDEPSLGLAPIIIGDIGKALGKLREIGLTVLVVEQNATLTCNVADRIYVLNGGQIRLHEQSANLMDNPELVEQMV